VEDQLGIIFKQSFPALQRCLFYINESNGYVLFDRYSIVSREDGRHTVFRYGDEKSFTFNSLKNAAVWCILDHENRFYEAGRVMDLDSCISSAQIDKNIHTKLKNRGDMVDRIINSAKLQYDLDKERLFQAELNKYTTLARDCQQRRFEHETNRNSRKQKN
jgi:hypothetical protein